MTTASPISRALAALGHDVRLSIYRLLVKAGQGGLSIGDVIEHLDMMHRTVDFLTAECCSGVTLSKACKVA